MLINVSFFLMLSLVIFPSVPKVWCLVVHHKRFLKSNSLHYESIKKASSTLPTEEESSSDDTTTPSDESIDVDNEISSDVYTDDDDETSNQESLIVTDSVLFEFTPGDKHKTFHDSPPEFGNNHPKGGSVNDYDYAAHFDVSTMTENFLGATGKLGHLENVAVTQENNDEYDANEFTTLIDFLVHNQPATGFEESSTETTKIRKTFIMFNKTKYGSLNSGTEIIDFETKGITDSMDYLENVELSVEGNETRIENANDINQNAERFPKSSYVASRPSEVDNGSTVKSIGKQQNGYYSNAAFTYNSVKPKGDYADSSDVIPRGLTKEEKSVDSDAESGSNPNVPHSDVESEDDSTTVDYDSSDNKLSTAESAQLGGSSDKAKETVPTLLREKVEVSTQSASKRCKKENLSCDDCVKISPYCHYNHWDRTCSYSNVKHGNEIYECGIRYFPLDGFMPFYAALAAVVAMSLLVVVYVAVTFYRRHFIKEAITKVETDEMRDHIRLIRGKRLK